MSPWQKIGVGLIVLAFLAAKVFVFLTAKQGIWIAALGAALLIFTEPASAQ